MFKKIVLVFAILIAAVLVFAATKPNTFRVQRTATIKAPPEKIYAMLADFHQWATWSPWEKMDPNMKRTFSGAPTGQGAAYAWEGNSKVGQGRMEILESTPPAKVSVKLDFIKPMAGHDTAEFTLHPQGDSTSVTWAMYGPSPYLHKVMGVFFNFDKLIGKDFEQGLANLKRATE